MIFSSLTFVCIFLPVVFLLYCIMPSLRLKNAWLILASLFFYAYGEPVYVLLMLFSTVLNYFGARLVEKGTPGKRKAVLALNIVINLGMLCVFKYSGFIVESINSAFNTDIHVPDIRLPIGISFFTFQALSYVIDVYMQRVEVQKNIFRVLLYISFFPQLIAGPIVKYRDINEAINDRKQDPGAVARGFRRFTCGLAKKVLIANTVGQVADVIFTADAGSLNVVTAWIGAIAYMLQIYYDFSGYSDMAIGLGQMFGFNIKENFRYPYGASCMQDFWRRWHISLSTWFKEYLYIPLGGNRRGKARTALNRLIVFFCTGLWHGASWTFVIWGLYHGFFLILEEYIPFVRKLPKLITRIYTLIVVCVGFVIFRSDDMGQAINVVTQMFTGFNLSPQAMSLGVQMLTPFFMVILVAAIIGAAPISSVADKIRDNIMDDTKEVSKKWVAVDIILYVMSVILLSWCVLRLSGSSYNPFIYFRF